MNGVIQFNITDPETKWVVDLKSGNGRVYRGEAERANLTISVTDDNFSKLAEGKLNPQQAFMQGKIKIKGAMGLAMKLGTVLKAARPPQAKL